jgi:Cellulase (glycosyl hydrolase family 5)
VWLEAGRQTKRSVFVETKPKRMRATEQNVPNFIQASGAEAHGWFDRLNLSFEIIVESKGRHTMWSRRSKLFSASLASLVAFSALAVRAQAQTVGPLFGVHATSLSPANLAEATSIKAKVIRLPVTWHLMEENGPGDTRAWFWDPLDAEMAAARAAGLKVIIEFGNSPCWATSAPKPCGAGYETYAPMPSAYGEYARALGVLASRYATQFPGTVIAYEVWNEPNLTAFWPGVGPRPAAINDTNNLFVDLSAAANYAALVKATYPVVKQADPTAAVLAGAISAGDVDYLNALYSAGIKGSFDALSLHPYAGVQPNDYTTGLRPDECPYTKPPYWCFQKGTEEIHAAMLANADSSPIWFTEFGYSSTQSGSHQIGGPTGQATLLAQTFAKIRTWTYVKVAAWYALNDVPGASPLEQSFGLYDINGVRKPAGEEFLHQMDLAPPPVTAPPLPTIAVRPIGPSGPSISSRPTYRWNPMVGATSYVLWVNQYGGTATPGIVNQTFAPTICARQCAVTPAVTLASGGAEFFVTARFANGRSVESRGMYFTVV